MMNMVNGVLKMITGVDYTNFFFLFLFLILLIKLIPINNY